MSTIATRNLGVMRVIFCGHPSQIERRKNFAVAIFGRAAGGSRFTKNARIKIAPKKQTYRPNVINRNFTVDKTDKTRKQLTPKITSQSFLKRSLDNKSTNRHLFTGILRTSLEIVTRMVYYWNLVVHIDTPAFHSNLARRFVTCRGGVMKKKDRIRKRDQSAPSSAGAPAAAGVSSSGAPAQLRPSRPKNRHPHIVLVSFPSLLSRLLLEQH